MKRRSSATLGSLAATAMAVAGCDVLAVDAPTAPPTPRPALPAAPELLPVDEVSSASDGRARLITSARDRGRGLRVARRTDVSGRQYVVTPTIATAAPIVLVIELDEAELARTALPAWGLARASTSTDTLPALAHVGTVRPRWLVATLDHGGTFALVEHGCTATEATCEEPAARCTYDRDHPELGACGVACSADAQCGPSLSCVHGLCGLATCTVDLDCANGGRCMSDGAAGACVAPSRRCGACARGELCWRDDDVARGACVPAGPPLGACTRQWPTVGCWSRDPGCDVRVRSAAEALARSGTVAPTHEGVWQLGSDTRDGPPDPRVLDQPHYPAGGRSLIAWANSATQPRPFVAINCSTRTQAFGDGDAVPPWWIVVGTDDPRSAQTWAFLRFHAPFGGRWRFDGITLRRSRHPDDPFLNGLVPYDLRVEHEDGSLEPAQVDGSEGYLDGTRFWLVHPLDAGDRLRFHFGVPAALRSPSEQLLDLRATYLGP